MTEFPKDIYTEPDGNVDTLRNLGPLAGSSSEFGCTTLTGQRPTGRAQADGQHEHAAGPRGARCRGRCRAR